MEMKDLLGGKGANLAEMTSVLRLPVPPGFTISTEACRAHMRSGWPKGLSDEVSRHVGRLENAMKRRLGDPSDPLLVSVRSGAKFSMPGMMDTVLNLGLNDRSVKGLARVTRDERFAYDSYRRFIAMYARIVLGLDGDRFDTELERAKGNARVTSDAALPAEELKDLCAVYKKMVKDGTGRVFPQDPQRQLRGAVEAVFASWEAPRARAYRDREKIPHDLGTAVNVQAMVFGNRDDRSGTGVGFTRDAATGEDKPYGDFLVNAQGEDVVAGIRNTLNLDDIGRHFPGTRDELIGIFARLEAHYRDMCDTEFTIEQGKLWMLQTRVGKRTGQAALRMAVDMVNQRRRGWKLTRDEALLRISEDHVEQVLHPQFARQDVQVLATGLAASPGAAVGQAYFTADAAAAAAADGAQVILVRNETSPEDVHGMQASEGILTARGGLVSHAAVVARGWGIPAVVGAEAVRITGTRFTAGEVTVSEGDTISIDGTTGQVVAGAVELAATEAPPELDTILGWADSIRHGKNRKRAYMGVRGNADTGADAAKARSLGAEGIGLCRTEHMFLGDDRLPIVREMILADTPDGEAAALEKLRVAQRSDFVEILEAMDGLPVTVRLLDPPLHEFLPRLEDLVVQEAAEGLSEEEARLLAAARSWHEQNPMLGTRGVRLGVLKPGLYAMQVRALVEAALERAAAGGKPVVEIMIPLTITREEMLEARGWVTEAIAQAMTGSRRHLDISIGTMIETPRAAVRADEIATAADFFSFGTNDLTQMALGFSRDDVEARVVPAYLSRGLLRRNPFETIDVPGVGDLIGMAVERGRRAKRGLKMGVCGEHGGDPESIEFFQCVGIDYVSCSPFRVPVARLAAAQAIVKAGLTGGPTTATGPRPASRKTGSGPRSTGR
jgi:pyruvate,orthophosphate dikinase